MSGKKQQIRSDFRKAVFKRDNFHCKTCKVLGTEDTLDAHHITDRNMMPNGGLQQPSHGRYLSSHLTPGTNDELPFAIFK